MVTRTRVHEYPYPGTRVRMTNTMSTDDRDDGHIYPTPWAKLGKTIGNPKYHPINKLAEI